MMAAVPGILMGISGLAGLFGGRPKTTTMESTKTGSMDQTNMPVFSQEQLEVLKRLMPALFSRINGPDLGGYETQGMANINKGYNVRNKALQNVMAARGLMNSPLAGSVMAGSEAGRIGDIVNFRNTIPEKRWGMQGEALGQLGSLFNALPTGSHMTGTSNEHITGTQKGSGDMMGGLMSGLGAGLASGYGYQWQQQQMRNSQKPNYEWMMK
jgi:hypothetical protein